MKKYFLLFLIMISCNNKIKRNVVVKKNSTKQSFTMLKDTLYIDTLYHKKDTIFIGKYYFRKGDGVVFYGIKNKFINMDSVGLLLEHIINLKKIGSKFICHFGCGTSCSFVTIYNIKPDDKPKYISDPLIISKKYKYIVAFGSPENEIISVTNLETMKQVNFYKDKDKTRMLFSYKLIDTLKILDKNRIFIRWFGSKGLLKTDTLKISFD